MVFEKMKGRMKGVIARLIEELLKDELKCRWQISSKTIAPLGLNSSSVRR